MNGTDLCKEAGVRTFTSEQLAKLKAGEPFSSGRSLSPSALQNVSSPPLLQPNLQPNKTEQVWNVVEDKADIVALATGATR